MSAPGPAQRARHHAALAVEVLGGGVHHQVGAQLQVASAAPGLQKVLSTTSFAPASWASCRPARGCRRRRSAGWWASRRTAGLRGRPQCGAPLGRGRSAKRSWSRRRTCRTPWRTGEIVEPKTEREQITWSPALSRPMISSRIALMPVVVATAGLGAFHGGQALPRSCAPWGCWCAL